MKVLSADKFEQTGLDGLRAEGCDVIYRPDLHDEALAEATRSTSAEVLVVRGKAVTAPMLEAGSLSLVVREARASTRLTSLRRRRTASTSRIAPAGTRGPSPS